MSKSDSSLNGRPGLPMPNGPYGIGREAQRILHKVLILST